MDYTEIIKRFVEDRFPIESGTDEFATKRLRNEWIECLNSPLAKQITEIEAVKGKIEVLKWVNPILVDDIVKIDSKIEQLEQLRDKLINELKLK